MTRSSVTQISLAGDARSTFGPVFGGHDQNQVTVKADRTVVVIPSLAKSHSIRMHVHVVRASTSLSYLLNQPGRMRLLCLLLLIASFMSSANASLVEYERRNRSEIAELPAEKVKGDRRSRRLLHMRALKGSKGSKIGSKGGSKSTKGSKGISVVLPRRTTISFYALKSDIRTNVIDGPDGYSALFPIYREGRKVGSWYEAVVYTLPTDRDGFGRITITFDQMSMLSLSTVAVNNLYPVLGGSGAYKNCVFGTGQVVRSNNQLVKIEINLLENC